MVSGVAAGYTDAAYPDGDEKTKRPQAYVENASAGLRHLLPVFRLITDLLITDY